MVSLHRRPSLIVHLNGGLGNQMFQIAAGKYLSDKNSTDLLLNLNWFKNPLFNAKRHAVRSEKRTPELLRFPNVSKLSISKLPTPRDGRYERHVQKQAKWTKLFFPVIDEENFFQESTNSKSRSLVGTFMSPRYFEDLDVSEIFDLSRYSYSSGAQCENIGVHIRLGDYLEQDKIILPSEQYYLSGIRLIKDITKKDFNVVIFSDSPKLLPKLYPNLIASQKVSIHLESQGAFSDFVKLSHSAHIIASNSTFSWWACRLNSNDGKVIVHPEHYFADRASNIELQDLWDKNSYTIS